MRIHINKLNILLFALTSFIVLVALFQTNTFATGNAEVVFDSEEYKVDVGDTFKVYAYLKADSNIGVYSVTISYDTERLEYVSGADMVSEGRLLLVSTGFDTNIRYALKFKAICGGEAGIVVQKASVRTSPEEGNLPITVQTLGKSLITIDGEEKLEKPGFFEKTYNSNGFTLENNDVPLIGRVFDADLSQKYIVDLNLFEVEDSKLGKSEGVIDGLPVTFLTDKDNCLKLLYLMDEAGVVSTYAYSDQNGLLYPCHDLASEEFRFYCSPYALNWDGGEMDWNVIVNDNIVVILTAEGLVEMASLTDEYEPVLRYVIHDKEAYHFLESDFFDTTLKYIKDNVVWILLIFAVIFSVLAMISFIRLKSMKRMRKKLVQEKEILIPESIVDLETGLEVPSRLAIGKAVEFVPEVVEERNGEKPVIAVKHVTMEFKVSTSNASGIKEYLIQLLKKQIKFRFFKALDDVSFNIYKGEVVGIIGTNGSGKSTLLKIVSGALMPTKGKVQVDRKKIQLLTLGTGFDNELSARENVFLNGSIIGYSEEFLQKHYDDIVEFAELEEFMDEKVKNFSSGMVSRLGFSIATTGKAADILILDEVLSVGDEFFRKKSLARVKEMIHGGSTVLMVSHSMATILDNCSKVVWIEKGKLQMVGDPKIVCRAYQKQHME